MNARVTLDKIVKISDTAPPVYTLKLSVSSAEGLTPNIFVVTYTPGSKYTGPESYVFCNVAYGDELDTVPEQVGNKRTSCEIRKSCIEHRFRDQDSMTEFIETVVSDIQRLIRSVNSASDELHSGLAITEDTAVELPKLADEVHSQSADTSSVSANTISLSFTGE